MGQISIRADEDLLADLRRAATTARTSLNEYVVSVLRAATDPDLAGSPADKVRERLARAGLLVVQPEQTRRRPDATAVHAARVRAGAGTPLSTIVASER